MCQIRTRFDPLPTSPSCHFECFLILYYNLNFFGNYCSTFFKEFHKCLVKTVKCLLSKEGTSEAIFFGPKRGNSLDEFLMEVKESGLQFTIDEIYHTEVWRRHKSFIDNDALWPNYEKDHCYPLLVRISF